MWTIIEDCFGWHWIVFNPRFSEYGVDYDDGIWLDKTEGIGDCSRVPFRKETVVHCEII